MCESNNYSSLINVACYYFNIFINVLHVIIVIMFRVFLRALENIHKQPLNFTLLTKF